MKPLLLELCGVNSFSEPARVDFSSLLEFGIFGIFGDTGSGKSTILDCIGFALYGDIARSRSGSVADAINYKQDKAYVNFEFEIVFEGKRRIFRVEREVKRKNAAQSLRVYEKIGDRYAALSEGVREGNALLKRIVGLEQKDFEKCIALPQGEFAQFVKAQRSDRLKLVSRLFDLERYGEGLSKKTNARYAAARNEADILRAKLEPFAACTRAAISELGAKRKALEEEKAKKDAALSALREEEKRLAALYEKGKEREALSVKKRKLEAQAEEYGKLEREIARLERAQAVVAAEGERKEAEEKLRSAQREKETASLRKARADEDEKQAALWNEEQAESEIAELTRLHALAEAAAQLERRREELTGKLDRARREFAEENKLFRDFHYEEERGALEERLARLGEGDFFAFAEEHGKAALLRGEYATFAGELTALQEKYPQAQGDISPLVQKYTALSVGDKTDYAKIRADFEARERERKAVQNELLLLEKQNGSYKAHCTRLQQLQTEGIELRKELEGMGERAGDGLRLPEIEKKLTAKRAEKRAMSEKRDRARAASAMATTEAAAAAEREKNAAEALSRAEKRLTEALDGAFESAKEAVLLAQTYGNAEEAKSRLAKYRGDVSLTEARLKELAAFPAVGEGEMRAIKEQLSLCEGEAAALAEEAVLARSALERAEKDHETKRALEREYEGVKAKEALLERLKKLLEANKFMEYVAEEYLQTVADNASGRLLSLTDGRYFLRYDGGFFVGDNFNGGALRAVYTLSGGETFLVSLSLALALSAEICARSLRPVEFFFLDEGFGTLDERLVDTVMDSLEKLKGENFSIGIISHVEELKHRIDRKLTVKKATEQHGSQIQTE